MNKLLLLSLVGFLPLTCTWMPLASAQETDSPCPALSGRYLCRDRTYDIKQSKSKMGFTQYEILEKGIKQRSSAPARSSKIIVNYHSQDGAFCVQGSVTDRTPDHRIQYSLGSNGSLIVTDLTEPTEREGARPFTCRKDIVTDALNKSSDRTANKAVDDATEKTDSIPADAHAMPASSE